MYIILLRNCNSSWCTLGAVWALLLNLLRGDDTRANLDKHSGANKRTQCCSKQENTMIPKPTEHSIVTNKRTQNSRTVLCSSANCCLWPSISFCPTPYSLPFSTYLAQGCSGAQEISIGINFQGLVEVKRWT